MSRSLTQEQLNELVNLPSHEIIARLQDQGTLRVVSGLQGFFELDRELALHIFEEEMDTIQEYESLLEQGMEPGPYDVSETEYNEAKQRVRKVIEDLRTLVALGDQLIAKGEL